MQREYGHVRIENGDSFTFGQREAKSHGRSFAEIDFLSYGEKVGECAISPSRQSSRSIGGSIVHDDYLETVWSQLLEYWTKSFKARLNSIGFIVSGDDESEVVLQVKNLTADRLRRGRR